MWYVVGMTLTIRASANGNGQTWLIAADKAKITAGISVSS